MIKNACLDPLILPTSYPDLYSCQIDGYKKTFEKIEEIGSDDVNKFGIYAKFSCRIVSTT
tara:strand:+ start:294 stop:473 length:180 start_codon:yes stop_codon:yes gene_type:complete